MEGLPLDPKPQIFNPEIHNTRFGSRVLDDTRFRFRVYYIHMSYGLNSSKGGHIGDYIGNTTGVIKGDTKEFSYVYIYI